MGQLRAYQQEDVEKLFQVPHGLMANDMGTGKTPTAVRLSEKWRDATTLPSPEYWDVLVIAPTAVLESWRVHFLEWAGDWCSPVVIDPKDRTGSWREFLRRGHVFIMHYEAVRLMPQLQEHPWDVIIADECQKIQNRKAQMTVALKKCKATHKVALSGTPTTGAPHKFWSVLNWLYPKDWKSYWKFFKEYVDSDRSEEGFFMIRGPKNEDRLRKLIEPYYVRRKKTDPEVKLGLPDKFYQDPPIVVALHPEQKRLYNEMKNDMLTWAAKQQAEHGDEISPIVATAVVSQLVRLQQFSNASATVDEDGKVWLAEPSTKIDAIVDLLEDTDEHVLIFSQFRQMVNLTAARLKREHISVVEYHGQMNRDDRDKAVKEFQEGKHKVFVSTIKAGGLGLTLTRASIVIFTDRDWDPTINIQAEDRAHRIGQTRPVQVINIFGKGTLDRSRTAQIQLKWSWITRLLDGEV